MPAAPFPTRLDIDYPDGEHDRLSTFFRPIAFIPIAILLGLLTGPATLGGPARHAAESGTMVLVYSTGGVLVVPAALMLLFRRKYPAWWFDWNLELTRFSTRCIAYLALLRDEYPSTEEEQAVHLDVLPPDPAELSRWLPLVKWLLALPHYLALCFLALGAICCVIAAWFAILFTGRYPRGLFDFVVGVFRWGLRVSAYAFLLTTDQYPPFSLEDAA
jgi:Domain of unknown function (DUF4389)